MNTYIDNNSNNIENTNIIDNNIITSNEFIAMDLDDIIKILSHKINGSKIINESLIEKICVGIKLYCQNHNNIINDWFDEEYRYDLSLLKKNNDNYLKLSNEFESSSFIFIEKS